jgi:phosphatidylethanolamine/phosphatidyl-N-methylethanolamine N-methyltransferase
MSGHHAGAPVLPANTLEEGLRFLRAFIAHPRETGAVTPSGSALARAVAAQIDIAQPGPILELGPGTGALTKGILARGIAPGRLMLVEYDPALARSLVSGFPGVRVITGDAFALDDTLRGHAPEPFAATVSGLPLLNYPLAKRRALLEAVLARMNPGAPFIQFSYGIQPSVPPPPGAGVSLAALVWRNLPPARVWVYRTR